MSEKNLPGLGSLETEIMEALWKLQQGTVREVLEHLSRRCAYTTVMTVLQRLYEKQIVERKKVLGVYQYAPKLHRAEYAAHAIRSAVQSLVAGFGDVAIAHFVDALDDVDPKRLAALRKKLNTTHT